MKTVLWTATAASDLHEIVEYIVGDSASTAAKFLDRVDTAVAELKTHPEIGRVVPELAKHNIVKYREIILSPWRLFYRVEADRVYLMSLIDGRRNIEDILLRRILRQR